MLSMTYRVLEPAVDGHLGEATVMDHSVSPARVVSLEFAFDDWFGDEILACHPIFVATVAMVGRFAESGLSGYRVKPVHISTSELFDEWRSVKDIAELPSFVWLEVHGFAGSDDLGMSAQRELVISQRAFEILLPGLQNFRIAD